MYNSYSTPKQNPGRMADRMAEASAQRLAAEGAADTERTFWLTSGIRAIRSSGASLVTRVRHVHVRSGSALRPSQTRP
jgi:hypothetical protein